MATGFAAFGACAGGELGLVSPTMTGGCQQAQILVGLFLAATAAQLAVAGDPIEELVRKCDLVAEIGVYTSAPTRAEIRYTDAEWFAKLGAVPDEKRFSNVMPAGPFNGWYESRTARVMTALKGCDPNEVIEIDFNNYATDTNAPGENIVFAESEHCVVFLNRYTNGHYGVVNLKEGKLAVADGMVRGWRGSPNASPLTDVIRQLREWVVAAKQRRPYR